MWSLLGIAGLIIGISVAYEFAQWVADKIKNRKKK